LTRHHYISAALVFALFIATNGLLVEARHAVAAANALASNCITPQLALAPALTRDPDTNPDGSPVKITPDQRGKYTPIIMIHGWTGTDVHNDARTGNFSHKIDLTNNQLGSANTDRSMIGQLQRIRGAAVFTFDYQQFSARWVDDSHIGPALGAAIDCLHQTTGENVILVGHSMGGLAARYAVTHPGVGGVDRATEVSTVVTFGTPETGSLIALLADGGANIAAAAGLVNGELILPLLRLFLAECGRLATSSLQTGTVCDFLPRSARAFDSTAGRALRYGSAQLAALKPWPKGIVVDALAGQATFQVPQAGWFALPWNTSPVPVGDMIVTVDSALTGASSTKQVPCSYQLNAVRGVTDSVALSVGLVSKNDVAKQPLNAFKGACFHTDLMRDIELTNEATGEISADIAARDPERLSYITSSGQVELVTVHADGSLTDRRIIGPVSSAASGVTVHALSASSDGKWLAWLEEPKTASDQGAPTTTVVVRSTDAVSPPLTGNVTPVIGRIGFTSDRVVAIEGAEAESSPLSSPLSFAKLATPAITLDVLNAVSGGLLVLTSPPGGGAQSLTEEVTLVGSSGGAVTVHGFSSQSYAEPVLTSTNAVTRAGDELLLERGDHTDFCGVGPSSGALLVDLPGGAIRPLGHPGTAAQQWRLESATFVGSSPVAVWATCSPAGVVQYNEPPRVNTYISTRTGWQLIHQGAAIAAGSPTGALLVQPSQYVPVPQAPYPAFDVAPTGDAMLINGSEQHPMALRGVEFAWVP
jgi:pimeloyl-ACP methyl ester carboxylesterase